MPRRISACEYLYTRVAQNSRTQLIATSFFRSVHPPLRPVVLGSTTNSSLGRMRTRFLLLTAAALIVRGKFVKIENLHLKGANEEDKKNSATSQRLTAVNRTATVLHGGYRGYAGAMMPRAPSVGQAKLLQSINGIIWVHVGAQQRQSQVAPRIKTSQVPHHPIDGF